MILDGEDGESAEMRDDPRTILQGEERQTTRLFSHGFERGERENGEMDGTIAPMITAPELHTRARVQYNR